MEEIVGLNSSTTTLASSREFDEAHDFGNADCLPRVDGRRRLLWNRNCLLAQIAKFTQEPVEGKARTS